LTVPASRPLDFRLALGLPLLVMALLLIFQPHGLDFALSRLFYLPGEGFIGNFGETTTYVLENLMHVRIKQVLVFFSKCLIALFVLSLFIKRLHPMRRRLGYLVLAMALCGAVVTPIKKLTDQHCPWSLEEFGGDQGYRSLFAPKVEGNKPGRCWPGGHATTGFCWFALFFFLRDRYPRSARTALVLILLVGHALAFGRIVQGAHFLSHGIWTMLFDWVICAGLYRALLYRPQQVAEVSQAQSSSPLPPAGEGLGERV